jgi:hypothetical protein
LGAPRNHDRWRVVAPSNTFAEGVLCQTELLLGVLEADTRPPVRELDEVRANVERWREQVEILRKRLTGLTVETPAQPQ